MTNGVCIVECIGEDDPGSEGRFLREVLRLMEVEVELVRVTRVEELFEQIGATEMKYVHVSTHGQLTRTKTFEGWWTPQNVGTKARAQKLVRKTECTAIVSTACKSGAGGFGKFVVNEMGANYYIGPTGCPYWQNAALFTHIYYYKLFQSTGTVEKAFQSYLDKYANKHQFRLFQRESG